MHKASHKTLIMTKWSQPSARGFTQNTHHDEKGPTTRKELICHLTATATNKNRKLMRPMLCKINIILIIYCHAQINNCTF